MRFLYNRREFITLLGGATATWPLAARAQQGDRVRRVGVLLNANSDDTEYQTWVGAFLQGLAQSGWIIGIAVCCARAASGLAAEQRDELAPPDHSITTSARASSVGGISSPSILAVSALMTNSNFDACTTGKSEGLAPLRIRPV